MQKTFLLGSYAVSEDYGEGAEAAELVEVEDFKLFFKVFEHGCCFGFVFVATNIFPDGKISRPWLSMLALLSLRFSKLAFTCA
jgi:hypothetical protein